MLSDPAVVICGSREAPVRLSLTLTWSVKASAGTRAGDNKVLNIVVPARTCGVKDSNRMHNSSPMGLGMLAPAKLINLANLLFYVYSLKKNAF
jgi:hypothetical protein